MRIKRAPVKAAGMEGATSCTSSSSPSPMNLAPVVATVTTNVKLENNVTHPKCPVKFRQGRPAKIKKEVTATHEETQAAKAKLRQYEALGHIKVEMDETTEDHVDTRLEEPLTTILPQLPSATQTPEGGCYVPQMAMTSMTSSTQNQRIMNPSPPSQPRIGGMVDVPILTDMEGKYGFIVSVNDKECSTKSPMWMMSTIVNKLYTNLNKAVPFEVRLKNPPADDTDLYVRSSLVFSSPEFLRTNVTRCPNHAGKNEATNHEFPYRNHVVRADHPGALYQESASGRLSVIMPLDLRESFSNYSLILLRFMCLGSCVGGINRRPISIVFTLENGLKDAEILGRKVIDVRVCACPTRDIRTDEQAVSNRGLKRKGSSSQSTLVVRKNPKMEPKLEMDEGSQEVFNIKVYGRQLYTFLTSMKREYYNTHPEYALLHPDPTITGNNSSIRPKKEKVCRTDIYEENNYARRSGGSSPVHDGNLVIDTQDSPPHSSTAGQIQQPIDNIASTMSLVVMNTDTNGMDSLGVHNSTLNSATHQLDVTPSIVFSSAGLHTTKVVPVISPLTTLRSQLTRTQSDTSTFPNGRLSGHVPVMQVRRESAQLRRVNSDTKINGGKKPLASRKNSSVVNLRPITTASVVVGSDTTTASHTQTTSHDSEEILAASILVQGFAEKK